MEAKRTRLYARSGFAWRAVPILFIAWTVIMFVSPAATAETFLENVLPAPGFASGWTIDGKVESFDKDNLFDHINGEAELYFPYGFEALAAANYARANDPDVRLVADVYRMGSVLDAFGIYSNYRKKNSAGAGVGAEGFVSPTQLLFYQDRYFVRLQVTGETSLAQETLLTLARTISAKLPPGPGAPRELDAVRIAALVPKSERYLAQSLLGYAFFRHGMIAEAAVQNDHMQILAIREKTEAAARKTYDDYLAYLKTEGQKIQTTETAARRLLAAVDPLYGGVLIEQTGLYVIGVVRIKNNDAARQVLEQLHQKIGTKSDK